MIRLASAGHDRIETAHQLESSIGGTESNVAVALARLGGRATWLSALPSNPLGRRIVSTLSFHGVDTSHVIWSDSARAGVYFLEPGAMPRPTRVIYDRAGSAVATIDPDAVPYDLVETSSYLHLTGITPALSSRCAEVCRRLAGRAADSGVPLVFDVNYRSLLWTADEAARALQEFLDHASILFCGQGDAATIWGLSGTLVDIGRGLLERSAAQVVIVTAGAAGAAAVDRSGNSWYQDAPPVAVVDPVGAGDAFAAGFMHSILDDPDDISTALRTGVAAASIAITIPGDLAVITEQELTEAIAALDQIGDDIVR